MRFACKCSAIARIGGARRQVRSGTLLTDKAFTGQQQEPNSTIGAYFYKSRFYSTTFAHFVAPDLVTIDGLDRYTYTRNSPIGHNDPTGMCIPDSDGPRGCGLDPVNTRSDDLARCAADPVACNALAGAGGGGCAPGDTQCELQGAYAYCHGAGAGDPDCAGATAVPTATTTPTPTPTINANSVEFCSTPHPESSEYGACNTKDCQAGIAAGATVTSGRLWTITENVQTSSALKRSAPEPQTRRRLWINSLTGTSTKYSRHGRRPRKT